MSTSGQTPFLGLKLLNEDGTDFVNIPEWQIPNENATEKAIATVDNLARTYGYSLTTSTSGSTTTTTLTVSSSAPYTATRKTVETVGDSSTTYAVTVTIDDETHTMTHTVGQTTASGATTDGGGDVIPFEVMISKMNRLEASVDDTLSTTVADLEQAMEEQGQDWAKSCMTGGSTPATPWRTLASRRPTHPPSRTAIQRRSRTAAVRSSQRS